MVLVVPARFGAGLLLGVNFRACLGGSSIVFVPDIGLEVCQPELRTADDHIRQNRLQFAAQEAVLVTATAATAADHPEYEATPQR